MPLLRDMISEQQRRSIGESLHRMWFVVCSIIPLVLTVAFAAHVLRTAATSDSTNSHNSDDDNDDVDQFQGFAFLTMPLPITIGLAIFLVGVLQEWIISLYPTQVSQTRVMQAVKQETIPPSTTTSVSRSYTTYTCDILYTLVDSDNNELSNDDDDNEQRWYRIHAQGKDGSHAERLYEYAQAEPDMRRILVWSMSPSRYSIVSGNDSSSSRSRLKTCIYTVFSSVITSPLIGCSLMGFSGNTAAYVWAVALLVFFTALLQYCLLFWMTGAAGGHTAKVYYQRRARRETTTATRIAATRIAASELGEP